MPSFDRVALVAGLVLIGYGSVLALDNLRVLELSFAALAPITCVMVGIILLANGLSRN